MKKDTETDIHREKEERKKYEKRGYRKLINEAVFVKEL